jgi:uncharacterized protein
MKFLTFVDLHDNKKVLKELVARAMKKDIDFVLCGGDISNFGRGLKAVLKEFNALGKPFYVIPGNHENEEMFREVLPAFNNCIDVHKKAVEIDDFILLGYGEGGFAMEDPKFRELARKWYGKFKDSKIIFMTHGPPYGTTLDYLHEYHVGNKDYRKFIERIQPKIAIAGHLHETAGAKDKIGKTPLIHPGWDGMVVEL